MLPFLIGGRGSLFISHFISLFHSSTPFCYFHFVHINRFKTTTLPLFIQSFILRHYLPSASVFFFSHKFLFLSSLRLSHSCFPSPVFQLIVFLFLWVPLSSPPHIFSQHFISPFFLKHYFRLLCLFFNFFFYFNPPFKYLSLRPIPNFLLHLDVAPLAFNFACNQPPYPPPPLCASLCLPHFPCAVCNYYFFFCFTLFLSHLSSSHGSLSI